jgi:hypothetical protein
VKLHYLLIGMACLGLQVSNAQESITVELPCVSTKELFSELQNKYKEIPIIAGIANDQTKSTVSIWLNLVTNAWTIVASNQEISCVVGNGIELKVVPINRGPLI